MYSFLKLQIIAGRPKTRGVFHGNKVNHPCYRNSSTRYGARRKGQNTNDQSLCGSRINSTPKQNEAILAQILKDKCINFIDPKGFQDLYVLSNPKTPKTSYSKRALTAKCFMSNPSSRRINQRLTSPISMTKNRTNISVTAYEKFRNQELRIYKCNGDNDPADKLQDSCNSSKFLSNINTKVTSMNSLNGVPSYLYKFMMDTSQKVLKDSIIENQMEKQEKTDKESNEECESQITSQSAVSIHKRYNQSSNDKQFTSTFNDPNTIITEKLAAENIKENLNNNESVEEPKRNRMLFSTVYKRHNQSSVDKRGNYVTKKCDNNIQQFDFSQSIIEHNNKVPKWQRRSNNNSKIIKEDGMFNLSHYNAKVSSQTPTQRFFNQHVCQKVIIEDQFKSSVKERKAKKSNKKINETLRIAKNKPINWLLSGGVQEDSDFSISKINSQLINNRYS